MLTVEFYTELIVTVFDSDGRRIIVPFLCPLPTDGPISTVGKAEPGTFVLDQASSTGVLVDDRSSVREMGFVFLDDEVLLGESALNGRQHKDCCSNAILLHI